jgi:hypothetical protein
MSNFNHPPLIYIIDLSIFSRYEKSKVLLNAEYFLCIFSSLENVTNRLDFSSNIFRL